MVGDWESLGETQLGGRKGRELGWDGGVGRA